MLNKILTFTLMGLSFQYFHEVSGTIDINRIVALNASHNEKCIMRMMRENFVQNTTVTMFSSNLAVYSQVESNLIKNVFNLINCSVFLYSRLTQSKLTPLGVRRNILIMIGDNSLKFTLGILHSFYIWDSNAVFLVVVGNLKNQKRIILEKNTSINASLPKPHVIVEHAFVNSDSQPVTEHYISNPNRVYHSKRPYETLTMIDSCKVGSISSTNSGTQKVSESTSGKQLRVGVIHAPPFLFVSESDNKLFGSEWLLIDTIAEKLNITIAYQYYSNIHNLGDLHLNENDVYGAGMLNDLLHNNIDVAVGNIVVSESVHRDLAISTPYTVDRLIWILPVPRSVLKLPFFPFTHSFKMSLFFISMYWIYPYLAFIATNHFHNSSNGECSRFRTFRGTCITFFAMSTNSTVDVYPKTIRMRFFLFIWLFYTYHLNMYFGSTLIWSFAVEQYGPSLKTMKELIASEMELGIDERTSSYFQDYFRVKNQTTNGARHHLGELFYCNSTNACLSRIIRNRDFAMTLSYNYFTYVEPTLRDKSGKSLLQTLPQTIVSVPIGIISKKGFALQHKINVIIMRINEAGLFNHWSDETRQSFRTKHISAKEGEDRGIDASYSLKYSDLKMIFLGIILELFVCCLVFVGELVFHLFTKHATTKNSNCSNDNSLFDYVN